MNDNIVILKSAYGKTPGQTYHITPCKDPITGLYPDCVRESDPMTKLPILSEEDKKQAAKGKVFIPADVPIVVAHGTVFDLDNKLQAAQWEAIKNSSMIASSRLERDSKGEYKVDGGKVIVTAEQWAKGSMGTADLYVEKPGLIAKSKNDFRKLVLKAQNYVANDSLQGMVTKCKLMEKDMSRAHSSDVEDWLMTQAEKYPERIIELYEGKSMAARLLLIEATDPSKGVIKKKDGIYYYGDDIIIGRGMDRAVEFLMNPDNKIIIENIKKETFPNLEKKS